VVLWEPRYFTRLWCVYELAAFVYINDGNCRRVKFVPLQLSLFAIATPLLASAGKLLYYVLWIFLEDEMKAAEFAEWVAETIPQAAQYWFYVLRISGLTLVPVGLVSPLFWNFCKTHMRDRKELLQQVRFFEFEGAECREEGDREFVREQIERWFGEVAQFEHYIRTAVADRVEEMLYEQGTVPYSFLAPYLLLEFLVNTSWCIDSLREGAPYVNTCFMTAVFFVSVPIGIRLLLFLADTSLGDAPANGPPLLAWLRGPLAITMIGSVCHGMVYALQCPATPLWLVILLAVIQLAITCTLYFPTRAIRAMMLPAAPQESDAPVAA